MMTSPQGPYGQQQFQQYPQYPPPGWQMPTQRQGEPPLPPKKRKKWPFVLGGIFALVILLGAIANLGGGTSSSTNTAAPVRTTAPYAAVVPAVPTPTQAPDAPPQTFNGTGDQVVTLSSPRDVAVVSFDCRACKGNVVVKADSDLLVNEIGAYTGPTIYGQTGASTRDPLTRLQINAKGSWTLTVGGLSSARIVDAVPVDGKGDDVLLIRSAKDTATFTHSGKSNFTVIVTSDDRGTDLVVNEIGKYSGTVILPAANGDSLLVAITADGAWTMA
ncbi:hypothetical protein ACVGVP_28890 (plasmid) [Pseudonocardia artemisiae]|nr:hypothetical protein [Pseudonocardia bannensis]